MSYPYTSRSTVRVILAAFLASISLFCTVSQQAIAFELFSIHLWGKNKQEESDTIGDAKYYSVKIMAPAGAPVAGIEIAKRASALVAGQKKPAPGSASLLSKVRNDYSRILAALYADGYYGGVISITIDGKEAAYIHLGTEFPDHVVIVITINAGHLYLFGHAAVHELPPANRKRRDKVTSPHNIGYAIGEIAKSGIIFETEKLVIESWRRQGYAKARIARRDVVVDHALREVDADISVAQGQLAYFGDLTVQNISRQPRMDPAYIAWMTGLHSGQRYDSDDIAKANRRLARLEIFHAAIIREADAIKPDGTLPLSLIVQERPPRRVGAGMAYSTFDGPSFEAYWLHRNLFGHAKRLYFDARISQITGNHYRSYNSQNYSYLLDTAYYTAWYLHPDTDFIVNLKGEREVLKHYTSTGIYLHTGFTRVFSDELSGRIYLNVSKIKTKDNFFDNRNFTMVGFLGGLLYDSRDNKMDAHRGVYGELVAEPFYEMEYRNFIARIVAEGCTYWAFDKRDQFVIAIRAKIGSIMGVEASELPSNMLFFVGGGSSVRGYGYRNIGVRTKNGDIIGGRSMIEGSIEARAMMTQNIGMVGFMDLGSVSRASFSDFHEKAKIAVGLGGRYKTGVGPIRFDVAIPLNRVSGDPKLGFYIGIGQAF
ncbi:MAG: translocation and assembly module TamA [Candidatus Tokpelaia sp. JSC189]|nr:MAG: translocation and assembly module TamA [Candidatus Tokpelaia sp. JSC189]